MYGCMCMHVHTHVLMYIPENKHHDVFVDAKRQLVRVGSPSTTSIIPESFNCSDQAWQQFPLPTEPSLQLLIISHLIR